MSRTLDRAKDWLRWHLFILPLVKAWLWLTRFHLYKLRWTNKRLRRRVERLEKAVAELRAKKEAQWHAP